MINKMYIDLFAEELVAETDPYAPPERYCLILRGDKNYEEEWTTDDDQTVNLFYPPENFDNGSCRKALQDLKDKYNIKYRVSWTWPADRFDEYAKHLPQE